MTERKINKGRIYSVPLSDIEYIGYFGGQNGRESLCSAYTRAKKERGRAADFFFNAELFDMKTRAAASDVVSKGKVHRLTEGYGMAFPKNKTAVFSYKNNVGAEDYIGAYPVLLRGGKAENIVPSGLSGKRARTALGVCKNNLYIALIPENSGVSLATLSAELVAAGAADAINLDGGGSTQYYAPSGNHFSGRQVRGFIGVWIKKGDVRTVNVRTSLNIRQGAGILTKKVGSLKNGTRVTVLEEKGSWCRIDKGWVFSAYLKKV